MQIEKVVVDFMDEKSEEFSIPVKEFIDVVVRMVGSVINGRKPSVLEARSNEAVVESI